MHSGGGPKPKSAYYRSLVDYNRAIMNVHYRKGSLLDYDGVYLAEGQWPAKAYFDAMRQARKRDAGLYHGLRIHAAQCREPRSGPARLLARLPTGRLA